MSTTALSRPQALPNVLRALIIGSSFWILTVSLTVVSGSVAAFLGAVVACLGTAYFLSKPTINQYRTAVLGLFYTLVFVLGIVIAQLFKSSELIAQLSSPMTAFNTSESLQWFFIALCLTALLRTLALRTSYGAVVEIIFVAASIVITLAAHRNGMIHRPFFIGDFALIRGIDPSNILMAFGCAAVIALSALLMVENQHKRLPYHFAVLGMLCFSLFGYVQLFGLPTPQMTDDLGLTGQQESGAGGRDDNPFRDNENTADDKQAPVAVVVFRDDYEPDGGAYYFRESAYSQFNGVMLDFSTRADMDRDLIKNFSNGRADTNQLPAAQSERRAVRTTIGTLVPHRSPFGLDSPIAYENTPNPNNLRFKRTYDAYSLAPEFDFNYLLGRETGREDWSDEVLQEYLTLPDDPRYLQLAQELTANLKPEFVDDPFAKAWAIKTYLDENGIYSLKNDHAYETDPAGSFLFGDLTGYCMHFSFAATYLYRSLGIPARVGIGYSVPAANRGGGSSLLIQAINGHAWPEIYFEGVGWVIVDPAPQRTLVDMTTDPQNELQQLLGDMLRDEAAFDDFLDSQQTSLISLDDVLMALYLIVATTVLTGYSIKFYRLLIPLSATGTSAQRLHYRAVVDQLASVGVHRQFGESREAFALRVSPVAPSFTPITQAHLEYALGSSSNGHWEKGQWLSSRHSVRDEINANVSGWKRSWGLINPFSWLWSK